VKAGQLRINQVKIASWLLASYWELALWKLPALQIVSMTQKMHSRGNGLEDISAFRFVCFHGTRNPINEAVE